MASVELQPVSSAQELAYRETDGLKIQLLYRQVGNTVLLHLIDEKLGEELEFPVPNDKALDAFDHPYAYAQPEAA
jgi:hypothetical protein